MGYRFPLLSRGGVPARRAGWCSFAHPRRHLATRNKPATIRAATEISAIPQARRLSLTCTRIGRLCSQPPTPVSHGGRNVSISRRSSCLPPKPPSITIAMPAARPDRYARCIDASKRVRWDIDTDVIRGRRFDLSKKFLPDGLSLVERAGLPRRDRAAPAEPDPGPHLRQHVRPGRALHRRQGARGEPRALARRPERAGGAGALHRRGAEAPGAVPPHRGA